MTSVRHLFLLGFFLVSNLRHPNILLLMAISSSPDPSQRGLVLEHIERAFLNVLLHEEKTVLDEKTILGISRDVACALQFVHQRGYIHCHLSSDSVTLTENYTAKVCLNFWMLLYGRKQFEGEWPLDFVMKVFVSSALLNHLTEKFSDKKFWFQNILKFDDVSFWLENDVM